MGHNRDAGTDYGDHLTYAQAAQILEVHVSNVAKLVSSGQLTTRGHRHGALIRAQVIALAEQRRQRAERRQERRRRSGRVRYPPPDNEHDWISAAAAAELIGISPQAVAKRLRRGRVPGLYHRRAWWVQREHALIAANVKATTGPDDVAEKAAQAVLAAGNGYTKPERPGGEAPSPPRMH